MTSGFVQAGFQPIRSVEWDLHAAATYAANFGEAHTFCGDIADFRDIPEVDVVIGGPPCQGFSNLGYKDPDDPRNQLWREYMRVVLAANPKVFVIENVQRFRRSPEFALLLDEVTFGSLSDYELTHDVLLAADYGAPQRRPRTIIVGSRLGTPSLTSATHARAGAGGLERWRTVRDAFRSVPEWPDTTSLPASEVEMFGATVPGIFKSKDIHVGRSPRPMSVQRYDCIPPGGGRFDLPDELMPRCWREKPSGTTDVMGRMRWEEPSLTVRTEFFKPEKGQYLHPQWDPDDPSKRVNRPITHLEAARLQTFPSDYLWCGTKIQIAKQIGNAVPSVLARAIAEHVRESLL